jgi:hypothetical protein
MTALVKVFDDFRRSLMLNKPTILVLVDCFKAFDNVCHELFILSPRHQRVAWGDDFSSLTWLVAGVSQGSLISPLCFSLFIHDMSEVMEFYKFHMYADDLQIYHIRPRGVLLECIRWVNIVLSSIFSDIVISF